MSDSRLTARDYLPDDPRWVETRALLATDDADFLGSVENFVVWSAKNALGSVVGEPEVPHILTAVPNCHEILAFPENIAYVGHHLAMMSPERASILKAPNRLTQHPLHPCRFLQPGELSSLLHRSENLYEELSEVAEAGMAIYAAFDGPYPVSFCYVASETETLWDVSIDTIASHRRQGFGLSAASGLVQFMAAKGKTAVWGAVDSNPASRNLALKLGFIEMDELWVL